jgi:hypothetical protein
VKKVAKVIYLDTITLDSSGVGVLTQTPTTRLGDSGSTIIGTVVQVGEDVMGIDNAVTITPGATSGFQVDLGAEYAAATVRVLYYIEKIGARQIDISSIPAGAKGSVVVNFDMYFGSDSKTLTTRAGTYAITIPNGQWIPSGTQGGPQSDTLKQEMQFMALAPEGDPFATQCDLTDNNIAYKTFDFCETDWSLDVSMLVADPTDLELNTAEPTGQIRVEGVVDGAPFNLPVADLVFESSDEAVATVDGTGLVTAVDPGTAATAEITITPRAGLANTALTVSVDVTVT